MSQNKHQQSHATTPAPSRALTSAPVSARAGVSASEDVTAVATATLAATSDGDESSELETLRARLAELEVPKPALTNGSYAEDDRVTVLHGWPDARGRNSISNSYSKGVTTFVDGVARGVAYADAVRWRDLFGRNERTGRWNITILPADAEIPDFARATGLQPMELPKLCAMMDAAEPAALVAAWGADRALRFCERITAIIAAAGSAKR